MAGFFASGHAVDLVLLVIAVEFAVLSLRRGLGNGLKPKLGLGPPLSAGREVARRFSRSFLLDCSLALMPGVCMLLALRAALTGAAWPWVAALLAASFPFHIADLVRRRL